MGEFSWTKSLLRPTKNTKHFSTQINNIIMMSNINNKMYNDKSLLRPTKNTKPKATQINNKLQYN